MTMNILLMSALAAITVGLLLYALMYNSITQDKKSTQRIKSMQVDKKTKTNLQAKKVDDKQRRKARESTLKNVEEQRSTGKKAANPGLQQKMVQAGMSTTLRKFYTLSVILGIVTFIGVFLFSGLSALISLGIAFAVGFGLPRWVVNFKRNRRFRKFTTIFPNAIDIIVRGIKSGLPLNDCIRIIANDAEEPVKSEFRKLIESTQMGLSVPQACERLYESVPTAETNFFAIVIAIQSSAGGNLSEALGNLSKVLRERRKMADKIKAFSSEAKTSAGIIGSLPFIVAIMISITTPGYLAPMFNTPSGQKTLFFCALSMTFGVFIMKKMINFKF